MPPRIASTNDASRSMHGSENDRSALCSDTVTSASVKRFQSDWQAEEYTQGGFERCFANNGQPYLKFITPTCTAAWAEQRTTCDTVLPSNAPSVQSG